MTLDNQLDNYPTKLAVDLMLGKAETTAPGKVLVRGSDGGVADGEVDATDITTPASVASAIAAALPGNNGNVAIFDGNGGTADADVNVNDVTDAIAATARLPYVTDYANIVEYGAVAIAVTSSGGAITANATTNTAAFVAAAAAAYAAGHNTVYVPPCATGFAYHVNKLSRSNFFTNGALTVIGAMGGSGERVAASWKNENMGSKSTIKSAAGDHIFSLDGADASASGFNYSRFKCLKLLGIYSSGTEGDCIHIDPPQADYKWLFEDLDIFNASGRGIHFVGTQPQWDIVMNRVTIDHCKKDCCKIVNASTIISMSHCLFERPGNGFWGLDASGSSGTSISLYDCGGPDATQTNFYDSDKPFGGGFKFTGSGGTSITAIRLHIEGIDQAASNPYGIQLDANVRMTLVNPLFDPTTNGTAAIRWVHGVGTPLYPTIIINPQLQTSTWLNGGMFRTDNTTPNVQVFGTRAYVAGASPDLIKIYNEGDLSLKDVPVNYTAVLPGSYPGIGFQKAQIDTAYITSLILGGRLYGPVTSLGTTGTITAPDASAGNHFVIRPLTGNVVIPKATNGTDGQEITFEIWQRNPVDGGHPAFTVLFDTGYGFIGGTQTAMGTTANKVTSYRFRYSGYSGDWIETQPAAVNVR